MHNDETQTDINFFPSITFPPQADFTETTPIPVEVSIRDVAQPIALTSDPTMEQFGGPLHPVLRRYIAGDEPQPLSLVKEVTDDVMMM